MLPHLLHGALELYVKSELVRLRIRFGAHRASIVLGCYPVDFFPETLVLDNANGRLIHGYVNCVPVIAPAFGCTAFAAVNPASAHKLRMYLPWSYRDKEYGLAVTLVGVIRLAVLDLARGEVSGTA